MGINVPNQPNIKPYNAGISPAQAVSVSPQNTPQKVDEEKSNAAKWMIGLTATAAIVIGGLYIAKKGHLGESAEKFARKLMDPPVDDLKPKSSTSTEPVNTSTPTSTIVGSGTPTSTNSSGTPEPTNVIALAMPAFLAARKQVFKLTKHPEKTMSEFIAELQKSGISFTRKADNILDIRTGKLDDDISTLVFENGVLRSIEKNISKFGENVSGSLKHVREFAGGKLTRQTITIKTDEIPEVILKTVDGKPTVFEKFDHTILAETDIAKFLKENNEFLPKSLQRAKFEHSFNHHKFTPRAERYITASIRYVPNKIPTKELVSRNISKGEKGFEEAVREIDIVRRSLSRSTKDRVYKYSSIFGIARHYTGENIVETVKSENVADVVKGLVDNDKISAQITQLIKEDLGGLDTITQDSLALMVEGYNVKFKRFNILDEDKAKIVIKPLKDCSFEEFMQILSEVSPEKAGRMVAQDSFKDSEQEQKAVMHVIKHITGRKNIDKNTSLIEILQDF